MPINIGNSFLLMGDAEELSENEITVDANSDVLKVGHHGSVTTSPRSSMTAQSCLNFEMSIPTKYMVSSFLILHCCFHRWLVYVLTKIETSSVN